MRCAGFPATVLLASFAPALLFVALHARALHFDFVWMDESEIVREALIRPNASLPHTLVEPLFTNLDAGLAHKTQPFYRPLQVVCVSLLHNAFGKEPEVFRAVSLALGAATAVTFTLLAWLVFQRLDAALAAGMLAAVHPAGLEVYVWIAGFSEALVDLFAVLSLLAFLLHLRAKTPRGRRGWGALAMACFGLGLLSKENGAAIPLLTAALAITHTRLEPRTPPPRLFQAAWRAARDPWLAGECVLAVGFLVAWRPWILGHPTGGAGWIGGSPFIQWLTALADWPRALAWLVLPLASTTSDSVRVVASAADPWPWLGLALAGSSLAAWWLLWRGGLAWSAFGLAWIWLAFLPTANLIPSVHARGERYLHLSVYGLALLVTDAILLPLFAAPGALRRAAALGAAGVFVLALGQRTWVREPDWRSTAALFERDVARDPAFREGRYELAEQDYRKGRVVDAERMLAPLIHPDTAMQGTHGFLPARSVFFLHCMVEIAQRRPQAALLLEGELEATRSEFAADPELRFCFGLARERLGEASAAFGIYSSLLAFEPPRGDPQLRIALARTAVALGRFDEARRWLASVDRESLRDPGLEAELSALRRQLLEGGGPR
ncbi:MAG TPA: tetratricopeptide repeat protein [Myxococcota bacterium]|nr:tetratricopeptide repeat protein [Myxococcota bacterium]